MNCQRDLTIKSYTFVIKHTHNTTLWHDETGFLFVILELIKNHGTDFRNCGG
jgi:hypothetical protein